MYAGTSSQIQGASQALQTQKENLSTLINSFDVIEERIGKMASRLVSAADCVVGSLPEKPIGPATADTPPHSHIDNLMRRRSHLHVLLDVCDQHVSRLESGLLG